MRDCVIAHVHLHEIDGLQLCIHGAEVRYNLHYRGKRSYKPFRCTESNSSYLWDAELRAVNAETWGGSVDLIDTCFAKAPLDIREIRARADACFAFNPVNVCFPTRRLGSISGARHLLP